MGAREEGIIPVPLDPLTSIPDEQEGRGPETGAGHPSPPAEGLGVTETLHVSTACAVISGGLGWAGVGSVPAEGRVRVPSPSHRAGACLTAVA